MRAGQALRLVNRDGINHCFHSGDEFNVVLTPRQEHRVTLRTPGVTRICCDIFPWMQTYVGVFEHPYFAVTDENGSFELPALPAGDYQIDAWHETLGEQTKKVSLKANATVEFSFEKK